VLCWHFGGYGLVVATILDFYSRVSSFGVCCRRFDGWRLRWWSWDLGDRGYVVVVDADVNGFI
jgi:hypothetical protein